MKRELYVRRVLLLITTILVSFSLFAQNNYAKITGRVLNADGKPADNLTIELKKLKRLTITDINGFFTIAHLPAVNDSVIISSIDSKPVVVAVRLNGAETFDIGTIHLSYTIKELQNVEIQGRAARSYKSDYSFLATKTETALKDIPQSISTITKELIRDKMDFTMKDAMDAAAGVNHYSGYDEYTIRGFRAENATNINGLRGYNTTYSSAMLVNIERIEIIKGPVGALYGNGDPGGTINLVTKKPLANKEFSVDLYSGSWNHFRGQTDITGPINKSKTFLYRFNAGYDNTKSFRSQYYGKSYQLAPSFSFIPNDRLKVNVDFSLSHVNTVLDRGQPGLLNDATLKSTPIQLSVSQPGDFLRETDFALITTASYKINKKLTFNAGFLHYNTRQRVANHGPKSYITNDSVDLYFTKWNYNTVTYSLSDYFTYQFETGRAHHKLLLGYDFIASEVNLNQAFYELPGQFGVNSGIVGTFSLKNPSYTIRNVNSYQQSGESNATLGVEGTEFHTQGVYVQDYISFNRWKFLLGLRQEFYRGEEEDTADETEPNKLTWRAGIVYTINPLISVYASYNSGFDPFEAGATLQVFSAPPEPIPSALIEAGTKMNLFANKLAASVAIYQLTVNNVAVNANNISNPDLFVQQGQNRSTGAETELNGNILPGLDIAFSYAYCNARITKSKVPQDVGKGVENAPRHLSTSWINYSFSKGAAKGLGISFGHTQASKRNTLDVATILPGYFILNASIHYTYRHMTIAGLLNNITNKMYWIAAYNNVAKWPGAPRNFMINIGYRFY